jgi:hypothetical protein
LFIFNITQNNEIFCQQFDGSDDKTEFEISEKSSAFKGSNIKIIHFSNTKK